MKTAGWSLRLACSFFCAVALLLLQSCTGAKPEQAPPGSLSSLSQGCSVVEQTLNQMAYQKPTPAPARRQKPDRKPLPGAKPYKVLGKWYHPLSPAAAFDFRQAGLASWYGEDFHGRPTSNGEIYDMYAISAAHKTLPLGTYVRVRNLENRKSLIVRINDRGPFVPGRIIDLSYGAARRLNLVGPGTAPVELVALGLAEDAPREKGRRYRRMDYYQGIFTVQVGAFSDPENARKLKQKMDRLYRHARVEPYHNRGQRLYRVVVGRCTDLAQAGRYEGILKQNGFQDAFVVATD